ncbi:MAG: hypothetical protein KDK64_07870, partial [Chlamydiia bacterium]|nr:hypothetical protein [Chlamydiia bacterium]
FALYALLVGLASNMKNASKFGSYPCPFIKIYEMEKSLGFEIMGNTLLTQELSTLVSLLKIKIEGFVLDIDMCSSRPFYWEVFLPNALKALLFLEKELSPEAFQKQVDLVLQVFFTPSVTKVFPLPENQSPPSSVLLPILIKYVDLNTIKESFDLRHAHLPAWEKEVKWIELHCKGIQHVSPERGAEILQSAREYVEQNIWAYPFSLNASAWTAAKEKALKLVKLAEQRAVA